ncbi:glucosamine-6-phosphate deaminase [Paenibacillus sp. FJAT-27812]|uniref:glucosamine-6-phosphate deaminase n=1 Tax=Paenibacillus sp. FJAT-27812 TaxID=1684143 RepID=UPI0006A7D31E|nr:glucosamine-6-phosphate deaminase [Paenibacillus sp. FJAT-27812]
MNIVVLNHYEEMSQKAAEQIIQTVQAKPDALLCFPGGDTPREIFRLLVQAVKDNRVDFSKSTFVGLDEWAGLGREDEGSCIHFLYEQFYNPAGIQDSQVHAFNAKEKDLQAECEKIDAVIKRHGSLDLILLGIGVNGHLGFNEPGASFESYSHVSDLDAVTSTVGQKYFKEQRVLSQGITLGIKHILNAKSAILIANGPKKADAVFEAVKGPVVNTMPASVLQLHPNSHLIVDLEAYAKVEKSEAN